MLKKFEDPRFQGLVTSVHMLERMASAPLTRQHQCYPNRGYSINTHQCLNITRSTQLPLGSFLINGSCHPRPLVLTRSMLDLHIVSLTR